METLLQEEPPGNLIILMSKHLYQQQPKQLVYLHDLNHGNHVTVSVTETVIVTGTIVVFQLTHTAGSLR